MKKKNYDAILCAKLRSQEEFVITADKINEMAKAISESSTDSFCGYCDPGFEDDIICDNVELNGYTITQTTVHLSTNIDGTPVLVYYKDYGDISDDEVSQYRIPIKFCPFCGRVLNKNL